MTIITDELIEAVARKMCRLEDYHIEGEWDGQPAWKSYIKAARTALETAMPLIGEALGVAFKAAAEPRGTHEKLTAGLAASRIRKLCGVKDG